MRFLLLVFTVAAISNALISANLLLFLPGALGVRIVSWPHVFGYWLGFAVVATLGQLAQMAVAAWCRQTYDADADQ